MGDRRRRSTRCKRYFSVVSCAGPGKGRPAGRAFEEAHRPEAAILLERSHRLAPSHHLPFALRLSNGGFHSHPVRGAGFDKLTANGGRSVRPAIVEGLAAG